MIKLIKADINQRIRDKNRKNRFKLLRRAVAKTINSRFKSIDSRSCKIPNSHFVNDRNCKMSHAQDSDTDSLQSSAIADLDGHIAIAQAQIAHLKKAGGIRFVGDRTEVYRPNKTARQEIKTLTERLNLMNEAPPQDPADNNSSTDLLQSQIGPVQGDQYHHTTRRQPNRDGSRRASQDADRRADQYITGQMNRRDRS